MSGLTATTGRTWRWAGATLAVRGLAMPVAEHELSAAELSLVRGARSDRRRQELRGGRAVAHRVLRAAGLRTRVEVLRSASGRPVVPAADWCVSICHGGGLVAAIAARESVGIDVEPLSRLSQATRVVQGWGPPQANLLESPDLPLPWPLLQWTAWEALGKVTGKGVLAGAKRLLRPELTAEGLVAQSRGRRVRWWVIRGHVLCAVVIK